MALRKLNKGFELVGGGSVIIAAYPVLFIYQARESRLSSLHSPP